MVTDLHAKRVLVIEDHYETQQIILSACAAMGFEVDAHSDGEAGLQEALNNDYTLLILDVGLPGIDGFEICKLVRQKSSAPLIVFVSSKSDEHHKVSGLELGADDYLQKPLSVRELGARIRTLLRRREADTAHTAPTETDTSSTAPSEIRYRDLVIDLDQRTVTVRGEEAHLTALEYSLLLYLVERAGKAISREQLMEEVWGFNAMNFVNTVNSHVSRVRTKIEKDQENPEYIFTVRGYGYQFARKETTKEIKYS